MMDKVHELVKEGKIVLELFQELDEVIGDDQGVTGIKIKSNKDNLSKK
jgi:thioredoxin reductase (NADPH)